MFFLYRTFIVREGATETEDNFAYRPCDGLEITDSSLIADSHNANNGNELAIYNNCSNELANDSNCNNKLVQRTCLLKPQVTRERILMPKQCVITPHIYILPVMTVMVNQSSAETNMEGESVTSLQVEELSIENNCSELQVMDSKQKSIAVQASEAKPSVSTQTSSSKAFLSDNGATHNFCHYKQRASSSTQTNACKHHVANTQTMSTNELGLNFAEDSLLGIDPIAASISYKTDESTSTHFPLRSKTRRKLPAVDSHSKDTQTTSILKLYSKRRRIQSSNNQSIASFEIQETSSSCHENTCDNTLSTNDEMLPDMLLFDEFELALSESAATQTYDIASSSENESLMCMEEFCPRNNLIDVSLSACFPQKNNLKETEPSNSYLFADLSMSSLANDISLARARNDVLDAVGRQAHVETQTKQSDLLNDFLTAEVQTFFSDSAYMNMETQTSMDDIFEELLNNMQTQTTDSFSVSESSQFDDILTSYPMIHSTSGSHYPIVHNATISPYTKVNSISVSSECALDVPDVLTFRSVDIQTQTGHVAQYGPTLEVVESDTQTTLADWDVFIE